MIACPMSHICGICVMHQCHVQHAKFMPGHVGFVSFPNKIETKHDDSTTVKQLSLFLVKNPLACHLAAIQQSRQLNGAQPNSYLAFQQFCYSHAVNLLAASHASVVEQCGDGGCRIADCELHLATHLRVFPLSGVCSSPVTLAVLPGDWSNSQKLS